MTLMNLHKPAFTKTLLAASVLIGMQFFSHAQASPDGGNEHDGHAPPFGHARPDHPGMHGRNHMPPFLRGVKLTEEQHDKIFSIMHAQAPLMREQVKAVRKAHHALHALAVSGAYEDAKARTLADEAAHAMAEIALLRARSDQQVYALLTPEQHKQADLMKAKFESHRMHEGGFSHSVERQPRPAPKTPPM